MKKNDKSKKTRRRASVSIKTQGPKPKDEHIIYIDKGMSLRDYFAAKAMQGILSNPEVEKFRMALDDLIPDSKQIESIAQMSYEYADAMIKERK